MHLCRKRTVISHPQVRAWQRPIPLLPRRISPALVGVLLTIALVFGLRGGDLYLGAGDVVPRLLRPLEYGPMLVAVALCLGMAPRFDDWDRFGTRRTRTLALTTLGVCSVVPVVFFLVLLTLPLPMYRYEDVTASDVIPLVSNVALAALAAYTLLGTIGRLAGTIAWAAALYLLMLWQASVPSYVHLLPLNMHLSADATLDTTIRWAWLLLLMVAAVAVAWFRRAVPLRVTIRYER